MKAVLFDLDGTVTDPGIGITNSVMYAVRKFGIEPPPREELFCFIGPPLRESFSKYFDLSAADAEKAVEYYREYYRPTGIFECSLYDGITDAFKLIKKEGVAVALATAKPDIFAERIAKKFGFDKYLSFLSGAALDGSRDNKADIITRALQNMPGVTPGNAVMVGDRSYDVESGKKLGLYTVGALYGYGSRQELSSADALAENAYQTAELALKLLGKIKN
ncbi:MAG: HAD hydrolase-like protein [Clostridia bacterium]|nr:HAD hydrolase-like protein [Clostridia bacterium]